jgi:hypothetical protein
MGYLERKERKEWSIELFVELFDAVHLLAHDAQLQFLDFIVLYCHYRNSKPEELAFITVNRAEQSTKRLREAGLVSEKVRGIVLVTNDGAALLGTMKERLEKAVEVFIKSNSK